jgi:hypothetical protein
LLMPGVVVGAFVAEGMSGTAGPADASIRDASLTAGAAETGGCIIPGIDPGIVPDIAPAITPGTDPPAAIRAAISAREGVLPVS